VSHAFKRGVLIKASFHSVKRTRSLLRRICPIGSGQYRFHTCNANDTHVSMSDIRVGHKKTPAKRGRESPSRDRHKKPGPPAGQNQSSNLIIPQSPRFGGREHKKLGTQAGRNHSPCGFCLGSAVGSSSQKHRETLDVDVAMRDCDSLHIPQQCTVFKSRDRRQKRGTMILNHFLRGR
jgi:hypothetical protein